MAKVYLTDATVEKVFESKFGWGVRVTETRQTREGDSRKDAFTLWMKAQPTVQQGDVISASGYLSTKIRDYEDEGQTRRTVDVSLNGAEIQSVVAGAAAPEPEPDVWSQPAEGGF